jgi:hypothetical protein
MKNITFDARGVLEAEGTAEVAELMKLVPEGYRP